MGLIRTAAKNAIADDARQAHQEGHSVFVARHRDGVITGTSEASSTIEAVEAEGWRLDHVAYVYVEAATRTLGIYVFRAV